MGRTFDADAKAAVFVVTGFWRERDGGLGWVPEGGKEDSKGGGWGIIPSEITLPAERGTSEYSMRVPMPMGPSCTFFCSYQITGWDTDKYVETY